MVTIAPPATVRLVCRALFSFLILHLFLDETINGPSLSAVVALSTTTTASKHATAVQDLFCAFNERDLDKAMDCLTDDVSYEDTVYEGPSGVGKDIVKQRWERYFAVLPPSIQIKMDHQAYDVEKQKVGVAWHLESKRQSGKGRELPFSKSCSFYTLVDDDDDADNVEESNNDATSNTRSRRHHRCRIQTGFRVAESPVKPDYALFDLLAVPLKLGDRFLTNNDDEVVSPQLSSEASIIEKSWNAWNRRDVDEAVQYFTEDVTYQDTLYRAKMKNKDDLRQHLTRVINQVPSNCNIVLDDVAEDADCIAAQWHLQVGGTDSGELLQGFSRGCSMYTKDPISGLIQTGLDVTESPLKVNEAALSTLTMPLQQQRLFRGAKMPQWF